MTKTQILKALRIERNQSADACFPCGDFMVCCGEGATFRSFSISSGQKAAEKSRADIRKNPEAYGIE